MRETDGEMFKNFFGQSIIGPIPPTTQHITPMNIAFNIVLYTHISSCVDVSEISIKLEIYGFFASYHDLNLITL